jgi:hypothetical protein
MLKNVKAIGAGRFLYDFAPESLFQLSGAKSLLISLCTLICISLHLQERSI